MKIQESFVDIFKEIIKDHYKDQYASRKRDEITYFREILYVITSLTYWNRYKGIINAKVLHNKHMEYMRKGFYDELFRRIINKYVVVNGYFIYKLQSTDTSFVSNKNCCGLPRNKYYKSKRGIKISSINDINGIPLSLLITEGSINDSKILIETINCAQIDTKPNNYKHSNKHKQYMLADKGYDTKELRQFLTEKGYTPIIGYNKRNIKDVNKLNKLTVAEKKKYKKRIVVENFYSWIKQVPKLMFVFEKSMTSYKQLLLVASSIFIFNRFLA